MNKNNLPTSIRENCDFSLLEGNFRPEAFVYVFENIEKNHPDFGKKNVGSHLLNHLIGEKVGDFHIYISSITSVKFWEAFDAGVKMKYTILGKGSHVQMLALEQKIQRENDVMNNEMYYNQAITGVDGCHIRKNQSFCKWVVQVVERASSIFKGRPLTDITPENLDNEGLTLENVEISSMKTEDVVNLLWVRSKDDKEKKKIRKIQVRTVENPNGLINSIYNEIIDTGDVTNTNFLVLIELGGEWYLLDGNHTLKAIRKSKKTVCKVIKIKEEILLQKKLSSKNKKTYKKRESKLIDVLKHIGKMLNRDSKDKSEPNSDDDLIEDLIQDYIKYGYEFVSERNENILTEFYNKTKTKSTQLCKAAEARYEDRQELDKKNHVVLDYTDVNSVQYDNLVGIMSTHDEDENAYVTESSSNSGKSAYVDITQAAAEHVCKEMPIYKYYWYVHHNNVKNKNNWHDVVYRKEYINDKGKKVKSRKARDGKKTLWKEKIEFILQALGPVKVGRGYEDRQLIIVDDRNGLPYSGPKVVKD